MARKTLSSQIMEEKDRIYGLLRPVMDISDPMTAHVVGQALEGLQNIESMCLRSVQNVVNAVLEDRSVDQPLVSPENPPAKRTRVRTTHKAAKS